MKTFEEFLQTEAIKGFKNAHSDLMKIRKDDAESKAPVVLHSLTKAGKESGLHDARTTFKDEASARKHHEQVKSFNPGKSIQHNLYVDGKLKETLK